MLSNYLLIIDLQRCKVVPKFDDTQMHASVAFNEGGNTITLAESDPASEDINRHGLNTYDNCPLSIVPQTLTNNRLYYQHKGK